MGKIIVKGQKVLLKGTKAVKNAILEDDCAWSKALDKKFDGAISTIDSKIIALKAEDVARKDEKAKKKAAKKAEREERDRMFEEAYNRTYKAKHSMGKHSYVPAYEVVDKLSNGEKYFSSTDNDWYDGILLEDRKILNSKLEEITLPSSGEEMIKHDLEKEPWYVKNGKSFIAIERIERVFIQYDVDDENLEDNVVYIMFFTEQNENFIVKKEIHF